ncbi:MAG: glycine--tRNA ligase subunit beta [Pseudomonadota bacterium]
MPELLLELFSEEIPARMQRAAAEDLKTLLVKRLADAGLPAERAASYVTPRRLTVHLTGVPAQQPDRREERKGPRVGAPDAAISGFLKAAGLTSLDQAEQRDTGKGASWFAVSEIKGRPSAEILPELLVGAVLALSWPKSMRWRDTRLAWVRPLCSMIGLFDGRPLGGGVHLGANRTGGSAGGYAAAGGGDINFVGFGRRTSGHRFLAPDAIDVTQFADYRERLTAAFVEIDPAARRDRIQQQAEQLAAAHQLSLIDDPGLLDEVTGLVEWPTALIGRIDDAFMGVPPEVLTTAMRTHQKYFALRRSDGALAPHFILVSNMVTGDAGAAIVAGNERVLRARLSDAKFFWDLDRKTPLAVHAARLTERVFHAKLGTVADKVARIEQLAGDLADRLQADRGQAMEAARLAKADLSSGMVGEFPELQGVMGRYYALAESKPAAVADAIAQHYTPAGPDDSCPSAPVSVALALADKIDTLAGFFAIDERPTGSKDPFALRRAALGILRIIAENGLRLSMRPLFERALALYGKPSDAAVVDALLGFLADRLKVYLRGANVRHDLVEAVFRLREDDFVRLRKRVDALGGFVGSETGQSLLVACRRAVNILRIEEKKDGKDYTGPAAAGLMRQSEETALKQALDSVRPAVMEEIAADDFVGAMTRLGGLRGPVDAFFEAVTVNCPETDLRQNRLRLLSDIRDTFLEVADFSAIEGTSDDGKHRDHQVGV